MALLVLATAHRGGAAETEATPASAQGALSRPLSATAAEDSPDGGNTDARPRLLDWRGEWRGWEGFHFDLTTRTLVGWWEEQGTNLPPLEPRIWADPAETGFREAYRPRFDETRMAGKIGVKLAGDAAAYVADPELGDFDAGVELRRVRLYTRGDCLLVLPVSYELEVGFIPNEFYIENSFLEFKNLGLLGSLKVGQYQAPMSLANLGSSRDMMFMEAPAPIQAIAPGVEAGFQFGDSLATGRMTWALGLFTDGVGDDFGDATKDFGRVIGRVSGLAVDEHNPDAPASQRYLHLGLSGYALYSGAGAVRYRSRPESHLAPYVIDTGEIDADAAFVAGLEAAWVNGPWCVQGEYLQSWVRDEASDAFGFHGFYVSTSWFPTGESRPYDRGQGTFARVVPIRNFAPRQRGWGAWELAARLSYVDLNNQGAAGGRMLMGMAGVNWYLHSHLKWRFDYGLGEVGGRDASGTLHLFQTRLEMDL